MEKYSAALLFEDKMLLGEGPMLDERTGKLSFVDIVPGKTYVFDEALAEALDSSSTLSKVGASCIQMNQMVGATLPAKKPGTYLLCATDGLYLSDISSWEKVFDTTSIYEPCQRSNDAKSDPRGRLFLGSHVFTEEGERHGNLFCIDGGKVRIAQADTKISNGMAWSMDKTKFYFSDSLYHAVFAYDYDIENGNVSNRQILCEIKDGSPDGLCIDTDDNLWIAVWDGSRVEKRDGRTGELLAVIDVPALHVTSCCFFGKTKDTLLITTSGENLTGEYDGCTFKCKVDAVGPETDYLNI